MSNAQRQEAMSVQTESTMCTNWEPQKTAMSPLDAMFRAIAAGEVYKRKRTLSGVSCFDGDES